MTEPIAYLNGRFIPACECKLPIYDTGIVIGAAVTDFLRTFNHRPYRMEDHVRRFYRSCKYAYLDPPITREETMAVSERLIKHNADLTPEHELGLVYYMTAGENPIYAGAAGMPAVPGPESSAARSGAAISRGLPSPPRRPNSLSICRSARRRMASGVSSLSGVSSRNRR